MTDQNENDWTPTTERGFQIYAGGPILTSYGHTVEVRESSAASGPHAWLFISDSPQVPGYDPHLNLEQALMLHRALGQFIDGVPARWKDGEEMLADARRKVFGDDG